MKTKQNYEQKITLIRVTALCWKRSSFLIKNRASLSENCYTELLWNLGRQHIGAFTNTNLCDPREDTVGAVSKGSNGVGMRTAKIKNTNKYGRIYYIWPN